MECQQGKGVFFFDVFPKRAATENGQEVKRRRVNLIYPAVGRLMFAYCPGLALRAESHGFDSPRPFLSLGSGVILRRGVP